MVSDKVKVFVLVALGVCGIGLLATYHWQNSALVKLNGSLRSSYTACQKKNIELENNLNSEKAEKIKLKATHEGDNKQLEDLKKQNADRVKEIEGLKKQSEASKKENEASKKQIEEVKKQLVDTEKLAMKLVSGVGVVTNTTVFSAALVTSAETAIAKSKEEMKVLREKVGNPAATGPVKVGGVVPGKQAPPPFKKVNNAAVKKQ